MSEVFISHVSTNDAIATRICFALRDAGIGTWIDHIHGTVTENLSAEETQEAIHRCQSGLFILSEDSLYSRKCAQEWQTILDQKKPLYVVLLEPVPTDDLPAPLWDRSISYIDLTYNVNHGLVALVRAIAGTATRS
jgi:hypothetical protein